MKNNYEDIKHLTRPQYYDLPPMAMSDRAAQFSPFEALTGYGDAVDETARLTDSRAELSEDKADELNAKLNLLIDNLYERPEVSVTYFVTDEKKSGGRYINKTGTVRAFDSYVNELVFTDRARIAVADIISLEIKTQIENQREDLQTSPEAL